MLHLREEYSEKLLFFAKSYESAGFCVIPLLGDADPTRAKQPAIKWGRYQHRRSTPVEHRDWFGNQGYRGLGIVLGRISNLVVLDFDDPAKVSEFRHLHADLADTYEVQSGTRRLPHFYYRLSDGLMAHSRSVPGIDFRADGSYVVAPPTSVGDAEWCPVNMDAPRILSKGDLNRIYRFLASVSTPRSSHAASWPDKGVQSDASVSFSHRVQTNIVASSDIQDKGCLNSDTFADLVVIYKSRISLGRNNALFYTACVGRDMGCSEENVRSQLVNVHVLERSHRNNGDESFRRRYIEAIQTIASAFSRRRVSRLKAATSEDAGVALVSRLSNKVREYLLGHGLAPVARVLDGLYVAGMQVGSLFTERQACALLERFHIGRRSVMAALKSLMADGLPVFKRYKPPCIPPTEANAAADAEYEITKCDFVTGANRVKTPGRPPQHYLLPSDHDLAARLGVGIPTPVNQADVLTSADLKSPTAYRQALHRELLKRRPGQYSRRWLSERLGISKWTSRRYEDKLQIQSQPMYAHQVTSWPQLEWLPRTIDEAQPGTFLEVDGTRYPPLQPIAARLLARGRLVVFKRRLMNHYQLAGVGIQTATYESGLSGYGSRSDSLTSVSMAQDKGVGIRTPSLKPVSLPSIPEDDNSYSHTASDLNQIQKVSTPHHQDETAFWYCPSCLKTHILSVQPASCCRCGDTAWEQIPDFIWRDQSRLKLWWQAVWRAKHPEAIRRATPLVKKHVQRVGCMNSDTAVSPVAQQARQQLPSLSLENAAQLVKQYGDAQVSKGLRVVSRRANLANPAGFLIAWLKSENLFYNKNTCMKQDAASTSEQWVERIKESAYVDFLVNADDILSKR